MRILLLGGSGMLGHRLWIELSKQFEAWVTVRGTAASFPAHADFNTAHVNEHVDALNMDSVIQVLNSVRPAVVINCTGIVKQLLDAKEPLLALQLNALFPHQVALACKEVQARLIHISTDCVFSGDKGAYQDDEFSDANDLYGRTKYLGEVSYPHTVTLRTSIIGRELNSQLGLLEWFLSQQEHIKGFAKAIYSGFTTHELAYIIRDFVIPEPALSGVYHVSSSPISKYDLLKLFNAAYGRNLTIERDSSFVCDRSLQSVRFREATGYTPPSWPEMIETMAAQTASYYT